MQAQQHSAHDLERELAHCVGYVQLRTHAPAVEKVLSDGHDVGVVALNLLLVEEGEHQAPMALVLLAVHTKEPSRQPPQGGIGWAGQKREVRIEDVGMGEQ